MKIKVSDVAAVNAALAAVNGKATAHTITSPEWVKALANDTEKLLEGRGLAKAERNGTTLTYTPMGPSANKYKYAATSTRITLQRGSKEWYLTNVERVDVWPKNPERNIINISKAQADMIMAASLKQFTVNA